MGIEYIDKTHARLVYTRGSGSSRVRRVKRIRYTSKKDAREQYDKFVRSLESVTDPRLTVDELLERYIERFRAAGGKATSAAGYVSAKKAISPVIGSRRAADLELKDIDSFIRKQQKSYSPKTIKNQMSLLSASYKDAVRHGILSRNPCEYAVIPRQKKPDIEILSDADVNRFASALSGAGPDFRVMCELALFVGLRRSEILGLLQTDISDTVTISKVRVRADREDVIQTPKTASSCRTLAVPKFIQEHAAELADLHKSRPGKSRYLIQDDFGLPVSQWWVRDHMNRLISGNGLPPVTMHGLRHTCASMLIAQGVPIADVSAQLGHSSIDITLRTYTHLFTDAAIASRHISDLFDRKMAPNMTPKNEKNR